MNEVLREHISRLREALLALPATGENGFEGLVGVILREISGVPFRLAGGGSQFGVDGKSSYELDAVSYECKRYDGEVRPAEILSKIAEVSVKAPETDVWVLGATTRITSQLADDARMLGEKDGICVLILDWSDTDLPPLAAALAMATEGTPDFFERNISNDEIRRGGLNSFELIRGCREFGLHSDRIRAQCRAPAAGMALAREANAKLLMEAFSNRRQAIDEFGQPLCPGITGVRERPALMDLLSPCFTAPSDERVVFVLGGEGYGKSWVIAQSWLGLESKPLLILFGPEDFAGSAWSDNTLGLVIKKILKQTGDPKTQITEGRWRRRLQSLRGRRSADGPSLVAVIDGINQKPGFDWARIIGKVGSELGAIDGRLLVSTRTPYFRERVRPRLSMDFVEIDVPEWTEHERNEILAVHSVDASDLQPRVAERLRNPRLLGIALALLSGSEITNLQELTPYRLLFEHMRTSERDAPSPQPAHEYARRLRQHAQDVIARAEAGREDDLLVFEGEIGAVADGRFFKEVAGEPSLYSLGEEGLTLALGFAVVDRLGRAERNNRDSDAELMALLDPIAGLDDTADVVLAALTVATISGHENSGLTACLTRGFAVIQNPDPTKLPAFAGLIKRKPRGFLVGARTLSLAGGHQVNFDWIEAGLRMASEDAQSWSEIGKEVQGWLSVLSLSPAMGARSDPSRDPKEKVEAELASRRRTIDEKLAALSESEKAIYQDLSQEEGSLSRLARVGMDLLAGKPLAPFATSFRNWCFSNALNADRGAPTRDFLHLVRLNTVDWTQTREDLLKASGGLRERDVSTTGKWALVKILQATGDPDDGSEARRLLDELTRERPPLPCWRRVESYCETDPCDPRSDEPDNASRTAKQYAELDVSTLGCGMSQTSEGLFFDMARPCVARFHSSVAVAKHRDLASHVLGRVGFPLRQGLFELRDHQSLLTTKDAKRLIAKRLEGYDPEGILREKDSWIISQYCLLLAFPFLTAQEQTEAILSDSADENILLDLVCMAKPLGEEEFEDLLCTAQATGDERRQYFLLAFSMYASQPLTAKAHDCIGVLLKSDSRRVRIQALGVIANGNDAGLLRLVAESGWRASTSESRGDYEDSYGSEALIRAAKLGIIPHDGVVDRISERMYGRAALKLGTDAVREIAHRIDTSIIQVTGLGGEVVAPDIEIQVHSDNAIDPSSLHLSERDEEDADVAEIARRLAESESDYDQRQEHKLEALHEFRRFLTRARAHLVLDHLDRREFSAIVDAEAELANRWCDKFLLIDSSKLPIVHNLILLLAHALRTSEPEKANALLCRLEGNSPRVRFTYGAARVPLDAMVIWDGTEDASSNELRFRRIDSARNDYELSIEVLAALLNGQERLLTEYIESRESRREPAQVSRAVMVAGFSNQSRLSDEALARHRGKHGLIGEAVRAAEYAYRRDAWARHWFERMCKATDGCEFWRYSVLFGKVADGRVNIWHSEYVQEGESIRVFGSTVDKVLDRRLERWKRVREKSLFGSAAPRSVFLAESR